MENKEGWKMTGFLIFPCLCLNFVLLRRIKATCSVKNYWMIFPKSERVYKKFLKVFKTQKPLKKEKITLTQTAWYANDVSKNRVADGGFRVST